MLQRKAQWDVVNTLALEVVKIAVQAANTHVEVLAAIAVEAGVIGLADKNVLRSCPK